MSLPPHAALAADQSRLVVICSDILATCSRGHNGKYRETADLLLQLVTDLHGVTRFRPYYRYLPANVKQPLERLWSAAAAYRDKSTNALSFFRQVDACSAELHHELSLSSNPAIRQAAQDITNHAVRI